VIVYPLRAISFDINGTLIHSPRLGEVYSQILGRHGIDVGPHEAFDTVRRVWDEFSCRREPGKDLFASHPGGSRGFWYEFIDRVCLLLGREPASRFAKAELFQIFTGPDPWEIFEEVPEVLTALQEKGVRMVVVSNWDERLPVLLENLGLARFFDRIVYSGGVGVEKPFAEIFQHALRELSLPPQEVVHIGDRVREDVEGARGVGMQSIHLNRHSERGDLQDLRPLVDLVPQVESDSRPGTGNAIEDRLKPFLGDER
jgi:putative hydrolase of the HAD superfamily